MAAAQAGQGCWEAVAVCVTIVSGVRVHEDVAWPGLVQCTLFSFHSHGSFGTGGSGGSMGWTLQHPQFTRVRRARLLWSHFDRGVLAVAVLLECPGSLVAS